MPQSYHSPGPSAAHRSLTRPLRGEKFGSMRQLLGAFAAGLVLVCLTSSAGASPAASNVELNVGADRSSTNPTIIPNGGTATITSRDFYVFLAISLVSLTPNNATARVELSGGLRWGADNPDPTEKCSSTPTTGECTTGDLQPVAGGSEAGWFWDVVAPGNGTYTFKGEITKTADTDPDMSNNASQITIVVNETTGGGGGGWGGGGGGGGSAAATASAVKLSAARPRAGSTVVASVHVTRGGSPLRPSGIACPASIGGTRVRADPRRRAGSPPASSRRREAQRANR